MPNAKTLNPIEAGLFISIIGPPGSGKSYFARSAIRAVSGAKFLFVAPPAEALGYAGIDIEYEQLVDDEWRPSMFDGISGEALKVSAWKTLMKKLSELEKSDVKLLIFDTMNAGPSEACWRQVMSDFGKPDPRLLGGNSRQPYTSFKTNFSELIARLDLLRFRKKCHIICTWHEDVRELSGHGVMRKETEKVGMESRTVAHWDLARLPELVGSLRESILGKFDVAFYAEPVLGSNPFKCRLVTVPDLTRLAKTRLPIYSVLQGKEMQNDFPALLEAVTKAMGGGTK